MPHFVHIFQVIGNTDFFCVCFSDERHEPPINSISVPKGACTKAEEGLL